MRGELVVGLMSGTSVDGIDAALVEFQSRSRLSVLATQFTAFETTLKHRINRLAQSHRSPQPSDYAELDLELAQLYATASLSLIEKSGIDKSSISAIANHGQTIAHEPTASPPFSLQIGDAQAIANMTGLTTISRFRQADLAAGGQGAPLMPAFHHAVFGEQQAKERPAHQRLTSERGPFVLNLGGIANITELREPVIGFDTGPANTLLNQWINQCLQRAYDAGGQWAASGAVIPKVLQQLLGDPYFKMPYPKSTGPDYFNLAWLQSMVPQLEQYRTEDIQATLLELTVQTIAIAIEEVLSRNNPDQASVEREGDLYVCGGGVHNGLMMQRLTERLSPMLVKQTDQLGVPADWVEAAGFAWLGYCQLHGIPGNLCSVTGASRQVVLGERFSPR